MQASACIICNASFSLHHFRRQRMLCDASFSGRLKSPLPGTTCRVSASADTIHVCIMRKVGEGRPLAAGPKRVASSHR